MFQTDIHLWLQAFNSAALIQFFQIVTQFGGKTFFLALLSALLFLIHLDKGFLVLQVVLITILVTLGLKVSFNMPRPYHVDAQVQLWDEDLEAVALPYGDLSAPDFWSLPDEQAIQFFREAELHTWGFPSGHTSMAVVFWGSLALLFRQKLLQIVCLTMIVLIPLSRLYLGVHFLADVVGGYLLGAALLWLFSLFLFRKTTDKQVVREKAFSPVWALGIPVLPVAGLAYAEKQAVGLFAFLLAAYAVHWIAVRYDFWNTMANLQQKVIRWVIAGVLYILFGFGLKAIENEMLWSDFLPWIFTKNFIHLFVFFAGGLWIADKINGRFFK